MAGSLVPRSLVYATDIDVLGPGHAVERRGDHLVVRSPGNPTFWWGNFLLFDAPPGPGERWEAAFAEAFAGDPRVRHRAVGWDTRGGELGAAHEELAACGYVLEDTVGLVAAPSAIAPHPRANAEVEIRVLGADGDGALWHGVLELGVECRQAGQAEEAYRAFALARQRDVQTLLRQRRGAWYVALDPASGEVAAACGVIVTAGRGRFQTVGTATAHRRRGICSRLVVEAARHATRTFGATSLVIAADAGYHALGLYESLGFVRREHVVGAHRMPPG